MSEAALTLRAETQRAFDPKGVLTANCQPNHKAAQH
jgi:hypothetical protein